MANALVPASVEAFVAGDNGMISELLDKALLLFEKDRASARSLVEQAFALADRSMHRRPPGQGALAAWQVRHIEAFVERNLSRPIRIDAVSGPVALSASYFSRAFKATFGTTFSQYVIQRRIILAKQMLLNSDASIAQIALDCGLADQSHLTRLFKRFVGSPPNAWRRAARCRAWSPTAQAAGLVA